MDPRTDRGELTLGLVLYVLHVGMKQAEDEKRIEEKVQADGYRHQRCEAEANYGPFMQSLHWTVYRCGSFIGVEMP